jgi:hypothetical protein
MTNPAFEGLSSYTTPGGTTRRRTILDLIGITRKQAAECELMTPPSARG